MIAGYVHVGHSKDGLDLFGEMLHQEVDISAFVSSMCTLGALDQGKWVHDHSMLTYKGIGYD
jgi:pentatricopeptide repeat protein